MNLASYYTALGLSQEASLDEIRSAYKKLVFRYHPDRNLNDAACEEKFLKIVEAYEVLLQEHKGPKSFSSFKRKSPGKRKPKAQPKPNEASSRPPKDLLYNIYVSLEEILLGCTKVIQYIRTNNGQPENIQLQIKVPSGARAGQRLKVQGHGNVTPSKIGSLYVVVNHLPHPLFEFKGSDLFIDVPVSYLQLLLGGPISVPTLEGPQTLVLNQCEFTNVSRKLENQGLPIGDSGRRGNLIVSFQLDNPGSLSRDEEFRLTQYLKSWPKSLRMRQFENMISKGNDTHE